MHPNEAPEGSDGVGPSQPPEGHELEDRDEVESGSESGQTKATDDDLVNAAQESHGGTAARMRPVSPIA
eukprot:1360346-Pleurochrysis_carterae.AAC.1